MSFLPANLPNTYQEALYWKLPHRRELPLLLDVVGFALMMVMGGVFTTWARLWHLPDSFSGLTYDQQLLCVLVALFLIPGLHKLMHGFVLKAYGVRPNYRVSWQGLVATHSSYAFHRNQCLVIALAPLVGISVLGSLLLMMPLPDWLLFIIVASTAYNIGLPMA
jgi:hypothetical protein